MSGLTRQESIHRSMRRHNLSTVKVEEKRLQKLLDFIDSRCQVQRSTLKRQIEDTQQVAENTEEQKHKATLNLLKGYFQISSGRVVNSNAHDERMLGVLSEPSFLPTVPEVDPDILTAPRSMYDKITRNLDTAKLPYLPANQAIISQPASAHSEDSSTTPTPVTSPEPWSDRRFDRDYSKKDHSYRHFNGYTSQLKRENHIYAESISRQNGNITPTPDDDSIELTKSSLLKNKVKNGTVNTHNNNNNKYSNGYNYPYQSSQSSSYSQRPTSRFDVVFGSELTPRLGERSGGISRSRSLRSTSRHSKAMSLSTVSLTDMNQTRKQKAADKLRTALKTVRVPR